MECPAACRWPFYLSENEPKCIPYNLQIADALVIAWATTFGDTVTSLVNKGFHGGSQMTPLGPGLASKGIFGAGAFPRNPGNIHIDLITGVAFNAHGNKGKKIFLPVI
ncbi:hypothetical protein DITRI_Ditri09bG0054900 [Diplodiscus trichospermus]